MALECICFPLEMGSPKVTNGQGRSPNQDYCDDKKPKVDLCKVLERTQEHAANKHSEYECHLKGEKRQNLINKIKMYLDDYDDRPVMKSTGKKDGYTNKGQTGFGPMIKYPGYVDYNHPYFSDPYDKMPTLGLTAGYRQGQNPCPPISVRNYDETYGRRGAGEEQGYGVNDDRSRHEGRNGDGSCCCAERRGEVPKCPAASANQRHLQQQQQQQRQQPQQRQHGQQQYGRQEQQSPAIVCVCAALRN